MPAGVTELWTIHKDTKNESNSQQVMMFCPVLLSCELYTKIQKMKAIHNFSSTPTLGQTAVNYTQRYKKWKQFTTFWSRFKKGTTLWTIHKDTKNESNSQPVQNIVKLISCCELYTKIQKMKAIHNWWLRRYRCRRAVNYTQRYKKWKQFTTPMPKWGVPSLLWTIHKDTKNESNSQRPTVM